MRKILLAGVLMAGLSITAKAQKGTVFVYGDLGFSTAKEAGSVFNVNPGVGFGINNNWAWGIEAGVGNASDKATGTGESLTSFKGGLFARYTKAVSNTFSIYGQGGVNFLSNYIEAGSFLNGDGVTAVKGSGVEVKIAPAVFVNVKNGFGLNFSFGGINYTSFKPKGADESGSSFNLNFGKTFNFGISKTFGGK